MQSWAPVYVRFYVGLKTCIKKLCKCPVPLHISLKGVVVISRFDGEAFDLAQLLLLLSAPAQSSREPFMETWSNYFLQVPTAPPVYLHMPFHSCKYDDYLPQSRDTVPLSPMIKFVYLEPKNYIQAYSWLPSKIHECDEIYLCLLKVVNSYYQILSFSIKF
jgi:hypothetical protein